MTLLKNLICMQLKMLQFFTGLFTKNNLNLTYADDYVFMKYYG